MANRVYVSCHEGVQEPEWFSSVESFLLKTMDMLSFSGEEVSVLFCADEFMQELNKTYRGIDAPTDVLSFEAEDSYDDEEGSWKCVGDIIISLDTLPKNAEYFEVDLNSELKRLLVHGLLHLNGMDHGEEHIEKAKAPECEMLVLQEKTLGQLKDEIIIA